MIHKLLLLSYCLFFAVGLGQVIANGSRKAEVLKYISTKLQKSDGGFGWEDQYDGHLTPTFAVVGILHHLNQIPKDKAPLIEYIRTHHPQTGVNKEAGPSATELRNLIYQQIQSLLWLGDGANEFNLIVDQWKSQMGNPNNFEKGRNPVFMQEMMTPVCRKLLGMPQKEEVLPYLLERRRENGSFNNLPATQGGDGNIINTYWGLYALQLLGTDAGGREESIKWLQACQLKNGGFTHQPQPIIGVNDDVAYTWAAIKSLELLNAKPKNTKACISYLLSLQNRDGGFGNQPGLLSTPMATYYAIDALEALDALAELNKIGKINGPTSFDREQDFTGYNIYTVQFQAHGTGSPAEAVMLAEKLGVHLWGAKNANPEWIKVAQSIAANKNLQTTFFHANEDYGKHLHIEGMGSFNHLLDPIYPASSNFKSKEELMSWQQYRENYLKPLTEDEGTLILQVSNNEPLARMLLDESLKSGGYSAISTVHFSQNFLFWLPHLYQYRYRMPFVALQDAHGHESWWWLHELTGYRTLFLAKEPTYSEMLLALKNNWVVTVRHDDVSGFKTRMLGGASGVQKYVLSNKDQWQWWNEETHEAIRPITAITVITPNDTLESTCPERGVNIRIRCLWNSNRQFLKEPLVKLERLLIDDIEVTPEYIQNENQRGQIMDSYYLYSMTDPSEKEHEIKAIVRDIKKDKLETITEKFIFQNNKIIK